MILSIFFSCFSWIEFTVNKTSGFVELINNIIQHLRNQDNNSFIKFIDAVNKWNNFSQNVFKKFSIVIFFADSKNGRKYFNLCDFVNVHHFDSTNNVIKFVLMLFQQIRR